MRLEMFWIQSILVLTALQGFIVTNAFTGQFAKSFSVACFVICFCQFLVCIVRLK